MDEQPLNLMAQPEQQRHEAALNYTAERQELFLTLQDMVADEVARQMEKQEKKPQGFWQKFARTLF